MKGYVDRVGREIVTRIDANAARIKGALLSEGSGANRKVFDELLDRARDLRRRFDNEGESRTLPKDEGWGGSVVAVARSSVAVRSVRECLICRAVVKAVFDFLSKLQYELSTDAEAQREHAETGGFCPVHTWLYANLTSPLSVSRAYAAILKARAAELSHLSRAAETIEELSSGLYDSSSLRPVCSVCAIGSDARDGAIAEMLSGLAANASQDRPSLCLPHLQPALRRCADLKSGQELVDECVRALDRVADDMRRYALKRDAIRRNLTTSDERDAHKVGLSKLAGHRRLALAQREDDRL